MESRKAASEEVRLQTTAKNRQRGCRRDVTTKVSSRKISGKWASAGTRLKRLWRTGGAGGIVLPNASLMRDEPGTRKDDGGGGDN